MFCMVELRFEFSEYYPYILMWQSNVPTKYQLQIPYGLGDIAIYMSPTPPKQCPYQVSTSYTLWFPRYIPDKILLVKVTTARSNVKSRSHHEAAYLHPLTNNPTKYQLSTPYGFRDIARTRFYRSRSLRQGQRSNQGHTMTLHTFTP